MVSSTWPDVPYGSPPSIDQGDGYYKVVLVTGSRDWDDPTAVEQVLDFLQPTVLIHGSAAGVDWIADRWAKRVGGIIIEPHKVPHGWFTIYGKQAPIIRNTKMVDRTLDYERAGHKVLVAALPLPGSTGTINCVEQAVIANLPVMVYQ